MAFVGFWMYTKLVYHDSMPLYRHLRGAHLLFSLTGMLWVEGEAPYWFVVPLVLNSTRIELYNIRFNFWYVVMYLVKNSAIALNFHWAYTEKYSGAYVVSVLLMDLMHWLMWELRVRYRDLEVVDYLSVRVFRER